MNFDFNHLYLTTEGRIGRQTFWIGVVGLIVASIVLNVVAGLIFGWTGFAFLLVQFIIQLVLAYPAYSLMAKRFQDRAKPATFAAAIIGIDILFALLGLIGLTGAPGVPNMFGMLVSFILLLIGIWILVELGFLRGTAGENTYGPDPVQG